MLEVTFLIFQKYNLKKLALSTNQWINQKSEKMDNHYIF